MLLALLFAGRQVVFPSAARAQQAGSSGKVEVGILVATTAAKAADALRQLKGGADFSVLAKEKSIDPTSNDRGSMGELDPNQLRPELRDALKGLKVGEYSTVVHIPAGFAVLTILAPSRSTPEMNLARIQELMSSGAVRLSIKVAGNVEENAVFADYPKSDGWERSARGLFDPQRFACGGGGASERNDGGGRESAGGTVQPDRHDTGARRSGPALHICGRYGQGDRACESSVSDCCWQRPGYDALSVGDAGSALSSQIGDGKWCVSRFGRSGFFPSAEAGRTGCDPRHRTIDSHSDDRGDRYGAAFKNSALDTSLS